MWIMLLLTITAIVMSCSVKDSRPPFYWSFDENLTEVEKSREMSSEVRHDGGSD